MAYAFDYAHMKSCLAGQRGEMIVDAGSKIGEIGNTGSATTGPHLHFQQRITNDVNPVKGTFVPAMRGYTSSSP